MDIFFNDIVLLAKEKNACRHYEYKENLEKQKLEVPISRMNK